MADPQVAFDDSPPEPFDNSPPDPTPEQSRQTFIQLHPEGPIEASARISAAQMLSHVIPPQVTASNPEVVSESLYGKPMKATGFLKMLQNTNDAAVGHREVNKFAARIAMSGHPTAEQVAKLQEMAAALPDPKTTFQGLPLEVMKFMYSMGAGGRTGLAAGLTAAGGYEAMTQIAAGATMLAGPEAAPVAGAEELSGNINAAAAFGSFFATGMASGMAVDMAEQARGESLLSILSMKDENGKTIDPKYAAQAANIIGGTTEVVMGAMASLGPTMSGVAKTAVQKAVISLLVDGSAKKMIGSWLLRTGLASGEMALANVTQETAAMITERATKNINNAVNGTTFKQDDAKTVISKLTQAAESGAIQGLLFHSPEALREARDVFLARGIEKYMKGPEAVPPKTVEGSPEAAAKAKEQVSVYREQSQTVEQRKTEVAANMDHVTQTLTDLRDKLTAAKPEDRPVIEERVRAAETDVADIKRQQDHPEEFYHRGIDYGENPTVGDVLRATDRQQESLDAGTQSVESQDAQDPEITDLNKQIEDLQTKLDATKAEGAARSEKYKATIQENMDRLKDTREEARNRIQAAVTAGRERLASYKISQKAQGSVNKNLATIKELRSQKWPTTVKYEVAGETRTVEVKKTVDSILNAFSDVRHRQDTLEGMQTLADEIAAHPEHAFEASDLARIRDLEKIPLRDLSKDDLQNLTNALKHLRHLVTLGDQLRMQDKAITLDEARTNFDEQLKGTSEVPTNVINEFPTTKQRLQEAFPRLWNVFAAIGHQDMLWSAIDRMGERGPIFAFMRDILHSEDVRSGLARDWKKPFDDWASENNLNINKWANESLQVKFQRPDGSTVEMNMRRDTRMSIYLHWQNENNRQSLIKGFAFPHGPRALRNTPRKLTEMEWQQIVNSVEDQPLEKQYIAHIQDLAQKTGQAINDVHERMTGYGLDILDNYWKKRVIPSARGMTAEEAIAQQRSDASMIRAAPDKSMTISRTGNTQPIFLTGATEELNNLITDSSTYVGMAESVYNAQRVLFDPKISEMIRQRVGDNMLHAMQKGLKDDARMYEFAGQADRIIERYRKRGVLMFLGWNPSPILKNLALTVRSLAYVPFTDWAKGIGEAIAHPRNTDSLFSEGSNWYADVKESGALKEVQDVVGTHRIGQTVSNTLQRVFMGPLKWASKIAIKFDMNAGKTQFLREVKAGHLTEKTADATGLKDSDLEALKSDPEQAMKAAIKYGQFVAQHGHATNLPELQSGMQRGGTFSRLFTTFQSEPNANLNMLVRSFMDANTVNTPGAWFRAAKTTAIVLALEPAIMAGITRGVRASRGQKQQPPWWDLAADVSGLVYGGRDIMMGLQQVITTGTLKAGMLGTILGREADSAVTAVGLAIRSLAAKSGRARSKASASMMDIVTWLIAGRMGGIPYRPIKSQVEGVIKKVEDQ